LKCAGETENNLSNVHGKGNQKGAFQRGTTRPLHIQRPSLTPPLPNRSDRRKECKVRVPKASTGGDKT